MTDTVLLVTGGRLQEPAVTAAHKFGLRVIVTDRDPKCYCASLADKFYPLDIYDVEGHVKLVHQLQAEGVDLRAVFTAAADPVLTVAVAAREAELHGVPVATAIACQSKSAMRHVLSQGNVPQPRHEHVRTHEEARAAAQKLGRCIVKAARAAGGKGHTKIHDPASLTEAVFARALALSPAGFVMVEELLFGPELSVESLWWNGTMHPLNAVERPFAHGWDELFHGVECTVALDEGWHLAIDRADEVAIELGHYNPAMLPAPAWDKTWDICDKVGHAIGLGDAKGGHILKCDLLLADGEPRVLECTVRLSGNWDSGRTSPLAHGVDYTMGALKLALGEPPDWTLFAPRWHRHAVCLFKFVPAGKVRSISETPTSGAEVIRRYDVGDMVPPLDSYAALAAWVIADGTTRSEAVAEAVAGLKGIRYEVES